MQHGAQQHDRAEGHVRARVEDHVDVCRDEPTVGGGGEPVVDLRRMALRRGGDVFAALVDHLHGPPGAPRQQRGMRGEGRRELLLASEPAARGGLSDVDRITFEPQQRRERTVHVERALQGAHHVDDLLAVPPREHPLRLEVHVLGGAGAVRAFDDDVRAGERRVHVAAFDGCLVQHVAPVVHVDVALQRVLDSEHRRQRVDVEDDVCGGRVGRSRCGRGDEGHCLGDVADAVADRNECWFVVGVEQDAVASRDVGRRRYGHAPPVELGVEPDRTEHAVRDRASHRAAVERIGRGDVVDVPRGACHLRGRVDPRTDAPTTGIACCTAVSARGTRLSSSSSYPAGSGVAASRTFRVRNEVGTCTATVLHTRMREDRYRAAEQRLWSEVGAEPTEHFVQLQRIGTTLRIQDVGDGPRSSSCTAPPTAARVGRASSRS